MENDLVKRTVEAFAANYKCALTDEQRKNTDAEARDFVKDIAPIVGLSDPDRYISHYDVMKKAHLH